MQQLGALDAVFVSMETPSTPAHIGGLTTLDPSTGASPFCFERFCEFVESRVTLCPRFSWKLQTVPLGLDLPYWVEDENFRVRDHIRRMALPAPGGAAELADLTGLLFEKPLSGNRPLWEMFVIEGLQGGRVAMLWKIHHCLLDGQSGAGLVELLFDLEPEPSADPLVEVGDPTPAGRRATPFEMAVRGVGNAITRPAAVGRHLVRFASAAFTAIRAGDLAPPAFAPRVSFNGEVGSRRAVAWTSVSLRDVKALKNHFDVTINDVVLELTASALRRYLLERGELPKRALTAMIPISTRDAGDASIGNQISQASLSWATNIADPVERLMTLHDNASQAKNSASSSGANLMVALGEMFIPSITKWMVNAAASSNAPLPGNAVVSNVRFTPVPLYIAGSRLERMVPLSLLAPGQGLNITVVSYCDELHFGLTVDPDLVPNPSAIVDAIPKALTELWEASSRQAA